MRLLLSSLSDEYDREESPSEVGYLVDVCESLLNEVRAERLVEDLRKTLTAGDVESAVKAAGNFRPVSLKGDRGVDVLRDREAARRAIEDREKVLVKYQGGAGVFFGSELAENSLVAFVGMPKGGKSYYQLDVAWNAVLQRKRTAYFQVGDLDQNQIMQRFITRAVARPLDERMVRYPIALTAGENYSSQVELDAKVFRGVVTAARASQAFDKVAGTGREQYLRLGWYPPGVVTINDIRNRLEQWDSEGWRAQVVVCDYLENLAPNNPRDNHVEQVADTWLGARQISMAGRCFVTGHQTNKEGMKPGLRYLTRQNFRGSLMVLAHATGIVGINQTDEEAANQVARLNWIVRRKDEFAASRCCTTAQCLALARPIVKSVF